MYCMGLFYPVSKSVFSILIYSHQHKTKNLGNNSNAIQENFFTYWNHCLVTMNCELPPPALLCKHIWAVRAYNLKYCLCSKSQSLPRSQDPYMIRISWNRRERPRLWSQPWAHSFVKLPESLNSVMFAKPLMKLCSLFGMTFWHQLLC